MTNAHARMCLQLPGPIAAVTFLGLLPARMRVAVRRQTTTVTAFHHRSPSKHMKSDRDVAEEIEGQEWVETGYGGGALLAVGDGDGVVHIVLFAHRQQDSPNVHQPASTSSSAQSQSRRSTLSSAASSSSSLASLLGTEEMVIIDRFSIYTRRCSHHNCHCGDVSRGNEQQQYAKRGVIGISAMCSSFPAAHYTLFTPPEQHHFTPPVCSPATPPPDAAHIIFHSAARNAP